jgi:hypothetical protein
MLCENKIWIENITVLFCNFEFIPLTDMSLESQMNSLSRLVIVIFLLLLLFEFRHSLLFLLLSLLFIIILYYQQRKQMENFDDKYYYPPTAKQYIRKNRGKPNPFVNPPSTYRFCDDDVLLQYNNSKYVSANQRLAGLPNPKTKISPVIAPPSHDLNYWKANNLIVHSGINEESQQEAYQSGFQISECYGDRNLVLVPQKSKCNYSVPLSVSKLNQDTFPLNEEPIPGFSDEEEGQLQTSNGKNKKSLSGIRVREDDDIIQDIEEHEEKPLLKKQPQNWYKYQRNSCGGCGPDQENYTYSGQPKHPIRENFTQRKPQQKRRSQPTRENFAQKKCNGGCGGQQTNLPKENIRENFPYLKTGKEIQSEFRHNLTGEVNTSCGYNPDQLERSGLPTNYPASNCEQDPAFKQYNKNLFTQTIQPGVYTTNEIIEPINANIGISFTQQLEPTTCKVENGNIMFTGHDPRIIEPAIASPNMSVIEDVNMSNIYDPRHSGYGTSYRSYNDKLLGQPKFMYKDIDAVRMPNYITRSNIDNNPFADSYGPLPKGGENGNEFNGKIRALANDAFLRGSIQFRTDMQQSLMRKNNANAWQRRMFPIRTSGSVGSNMSCN